MFILVNQKFVDFFLFWLWIFILVNYKTLDFLCVLVVDDYIPDYPVDFWWWMFILVHQNLVFWLWMIIRDFFFFALVVDVSPSKSCVYLFLDVYFGEV